MVCYGDVMKEAWRLPCAAICLLTPPHLLGTPHNSHLQIPIIISEMSFKTMSHVIRSKSEFWNASRHPAQRRHILSKKSLKKILKRTVLIFISVYIYIYSVNVVVSFYIYSYACIYVRICFLYMYIYIKKVVWVYLHVNT